MLATAHTFTLDGISARPVRVEVDVHRGLPGFAIVGLPDTAVREARERVRAALDNCGFEFPLRRIVVNLAPASLRKAGPGMDLAIASALLSASGQLEWERLARVAMVGELALDGSTRAVNGALAIAEAAREGGAEAIVVPLLVVHGELDTNVPRNEAEQIVARLRELDRDVDYLELAGEGHEYRRAESRLELLHGITRFLNRTLLPERAHRG